jgi:hypothetical protein
MDSGMAAFLGVLVGSLITGTVTLVAEVLRSRTHSREESARRESERRLQKVDFQRENLLAIQVSLLSWMRTEMKHFQFDIKQVRERGQLTRLPADLDAENHEATRDLTHLVARVTDDDLRDSIKGLTRRAAEVAAHNAVLHREVDESLLLAQMNELSNLYVEVEASLGRTLRLLL